MPNSRTVDRSRITRVVGGLVAALATAVALSGCLPPAGTDPIASPPAPAGCITEVGPATRLVFGGCGGDITYNVSVPARCLTHACGLILDVHGWTMSGATQDSGTQIAAIGGAAGYIVVQPNAPAASNGLTSWTSSHYPYVASFVEQAIDVWRVEERRVHVTGFSQGGAMTYWMRCQRADLFASAAPTAMSGTACANGTNMPTLYVQGLDDIFISQAAIDSTIASFVNRHGLDRQLTLLDEDGVTITGYGSSTNPDVPAFRTVIHSHTSYGVVGHCILGAPDPADPYGCDQPTEWSHGRLVVEFFQDTPKPA